MLNGFTAHGASLLLFRVAILVPFENALEAIVAVSARHHHRHLLTILTDDAKVIILLLQVHVQHLLLDVGTERDPTPWLVAFFGMITAQGNELFANRAATIGFALAALVVNNDPLHLPARV